MKLISINIEGHKHLESRVLPFLKSEQADAICLQEVFRVDVPRLELELGLQGNFVPVANVLSPNHYLAHGLGELGVYMGSRGKVLEQGQFFYQGPSLVLPVPDPNQHEHNLYDRVLVWQRFEFVGAGVETKVGAIQAYTVVTTHFTYAIEGGVNQLQRDHLQAALAYLSTLPPHLLCGDFNAPRGGEIWGKLAENYQDNIPVAIKTTIDNHLHRAKDKIELVVDGLFSQPEYEVSGVRVVPGVSDHQAVVGDVKRVR